MCQRETEASEQASKRSRREPERERARSLASRRAYECTRRHKHALFMIYIICSAPSLDEINELTRFVQLILLDHAAHDCGRQAR